MCERAPPRIRNPNDTGGPHPLSDPLFGYGHWIVTIEIFSYLALVSIIALIAVLWRPGPFSEGIWSTWESAQTSGRPSEATQLNGGRCAPARIGLSNKQ